MLKKRILIIDDEQGIVTVMKFNLETLGKYEVCTETKTEHVLERAHEFKPDLILMDLVMPGIPGDVLVHFIEEDPILKSAPIVFLSGMMTHDQALSDPRVGNHPYLEKPVDIDRLLECIERYAA